MLDNMLHRREDIYMNNNKQRPQSPKHMNRHDSQRFDKGRFVRDMKAPRYSRSELRMSILSGRFEA